MTPEFEPRRHSLSPVLRAQAVMLGLEVEFGVHGVRGWETSGRCSPMSRAGDDTFATARTSGAHVGRRWERSVTIRGANCLGPRSSLFSPLRH